MTNCKACKRSSSSKSTKCTHESTSDWLCSSSSSSSGCSCSTVSSSECSTSDLYTCPSSSKTCKNSSSCSSGSSSSSSSSSSCCSSSSQCGGLTCRAFKKAKKAKEEPIRTFEKYNATEIYAHFRDAVVNVVGTVGYTGSTGAANLSYSGNGFFMTKKHFVVCPAHLVVVPPALGGVNRLPNAPLGQIAPVSQILVTVFNVNGGNDSYVYPATLVGVDGAGDIALLKVNSTNCNGAPKIKHCHPYFKFGDSLKYSPGNKVYSLGTLFGGDFRSVTTGVVRNNKQFDQTGQIVYEAVGTTLPYDAQRIFETVYGTQIALTHLNGPDGAPILDVTGRVVGMVTYALNIVPRGLQVASSVPPDNGSVNSDNYAVGVSQRFMMCVLKALVKSYCRGEARHNTVLLTDTGLPAPTGTGNLTFYNYIKGYIGVAFEVITGNFYAGLSAIGVTGGTGAQCTQIVGIATVPSGTGATGFTGVTGTAITHVNCVQIGNLSDQLALSTFDWRKVPGDCARLTTREVASQYNTCSEVKITYTGFPSAFDYSPMLYNGIAAKAQL